ncbi:MAG TPA: histidine kinase [Microbacteriaceae bacterium]
MDAMGHDALADRSEWHGWLSRGWATVRSRSARGWYFGASWGLVYQIIMVSYLWTASEAVADKLIGSVLLVPYYVGFVLLPPLSWGESRRIRFTVLGAYWAYSLLLVPFIGPYIFWLWLLVAAMLPLLCDVLLLDLAAVGVLVAGPLIYGFITDFTNSIAISAPVIFGVAAMMYGVNQQLKGVRELRQAQGEVARLAVVEERARFSRDLHDVLGHSLTVVTVKSELARRLVSIDPARAEEEIADIERLTRAALADLRAAVAGYREMTLSTELGAAQAALAAADIEPHLPPNADPAAADLGELFGWVLREAVTNVVRHSGARNCWVNATHTELTVDDDGHGFADAPAAATRNGAGGAGGGLTSGHASCPASGVGLLGLRERAQKAGAELTVTASGRGGVRVAVRRAA